MNITIIFCQCGSLLSNSLNLDDFKHIINQENIFFENIGLACSEDNRPHLIETIKRNHTDGIIFVGCSPNFKGEYLRNLAKDAGINPYMIAFVNIREQALWVTDDKTALSKKVKALLTGSIDRLKKQRPVEEKILFSCKDVLVIGAGASGLQSALTLSKTGHKVYLIEHTNYIGGRAVTYEKLFPNLECGPCRLHPLIDEVMNDESITLMTSSELSDIKGSKGNYFAKILCRKNFVNVKKCIGCFQCVEVCPEKCISIDMIRQPLIAKIEYSRCLLSRGFDCNLCIRECPVEDTIRFDVTDKIEEIKVGSIILATGFNLFDCTRIESLGYKRHDDIYTSEEFEEIVNSQGYTKGKILTKSGNKPERIAIIHCVGSLDDDYLPYCSKICCQQAFKLNRQIREAIPNVTISHFVKEIVVPGKDAYKLYSQSKQDQLTEILRYNTIKELSIRQEERLSLFCNINKYVYDIIILEPAIECKISINLDNVLYAGSIKEPMTVEESLTDAMSTVAQLISSTKGGEYLVKDFPIAHINEQKCSKCSTCISLCPFKSIDIKDNKIKIIEELCEGCGCCVASCPSNAIDLEGFTKEQIINEINGILRCLEEG